MCDGDGLGVMWLRWRGLWLEQMWKDPGLRPVARARTKTGLTGEVARPARERGRGDLDAWRRGCIRNDGDAGELLEHWLVMDFTRDAELRSEPLRLS